MNALKTKAFIAETQQCNISSCGKLHFLLLRKSPRICVPWLPCHCALRQCWTHHHQLPISNLSSSYWHRRVSSCELTRRVPTPSRVTAQQLPKRLQGQWVNGRLLSTSRFRRLVSTTFSRVLITLFLDPPKYRTESWCRTSLAFPRAHLID